MITEPSKITFLIESTVWIIAETSHPLCDPIQTKYNLIFSCCRQQAQLQQVVQTLQSTEEYSKLTPAQLQVVAMQILVKENQKQVS